MMGCGSCVLSIYFLVCCVFQEPKFPSALHVFHQGVLKGKFPISSLYSFPFDAITNYQKFNGIKITEIYILL